MGGWAVVKARRLLYLSRKVSSEVGGGRSSPLWEDRDERTGGLGG